MTSETDAAMAPPPTPAHAASGVAKGPTEKVPAAKGWEDNPVIRLFSSYGLVVVTMILLGLLTWLGTLAQLDRDVYDVQKEYFSSWFVMATVKGWVVPGLGKELTIPLPGATLLLAVLFVNLLVGGIVRLRRRWDRLGILITHVGIALLLVAGGIEFQAKDEGSLSMFEGEAAAHFSSNYDWELVVHERLDADDGSSGDSIGRPRVREHAIRDAHLLGQTEAVEFEVDGLPAKVVVEHYYRNAEIKSARRKRSTPTPVVNGFFAQPLPKEQSSEQNMPAAYVRFGEERLLLAGSRPISAEYVVTKVVRKDGRTFAFQLRNRQYPLPFEVKLEDFRVERHPGSGVARSYESDVELREGPDAEAGEPVRIWMNNPLRKEGFTLYQSGWGPQDQRDPSVYYSVFSVVRNPSDQMPAWACWIIALGLLIHYLVRLFFYIRAQTRGSYS